MFDISKIKDPEFLKNLNYKEKKELAKEIRTFLIEHIAKTGGHLASNLGIVELVIALYSVFDYKNDKFIYDVGHQSYVHKILTGRAKYFDELRKYNGLSGYISYKESPYDIWESGHSSTSISALAGLLLAEGKNSKHKIIAIIGDASITNGVSFEALNYLGTLKGYSPIIILNDNKMGISKSVGSLNLVFDKLRSKKFIISLKKFTNAILPRFITNGFHHLKRAIKGYIQQDNIFEDLGFDYYGPVDGNDIRAITKALERIKDLEGPIILHVLTKKGLGYDLAAQDDIGTFHGVPPFDIKTGKPLKEKKPLIHSFSEVVCECLCLLREKEEFYVITPATKVGAALEKFYKLYPDNLIDVGIAEEHAAVMASGLVKGGKKAIVLMYSTFSQRAYDFFLNDIARPNIPVIIGIDRAGVVGHDGPTHQGIYDIAMFSSMPNIVVTAPRNSNEVMGLFKLALNINKPIVIRYPRTDTICDFSKLQINEIKLEWEIIKEGHLGIVIAYGPILDELLKLIVLNDLDVYLINARIIKPLDFKMLDYLKSLNLKFLVIEEVISSGSLYSKLLEYGIYNINKINFDVDDIIPQGDIKEVLNLYGFSKENIIKEIKKLYEN